MPLIFPFKALRPAAGYEALVTAKSSDFESNENLIHSLLQNPLSYHRLTKSNLLGDESAESNLKKASGYIIDLKQKNVLIKDEEEAFYLYMQHDIATGNSFTTLFALCNIEDYLNDKIKKHENTQAIREKQMAMLFEETNVLGEGVLLSHSHHDELSSLYHHIKNREPEISFESVDNKSHQIWIVSKPAETNQIKRLLDVEANFYIADGHHRSASMARLFSEEKKEKFRYFLACLVDETQLRISPFYRWLKLETIPSLDFILEKIHNHYKCYPIDVPYYFPETRGAFGMYFNRQWYKLKPVHLTDTGNVLENLDVTILEKQILGPIFNVVDSKTDHRLHYKPANTFPEEFEEMINNGTYSLGFTLHAPEITDIKEVADAHLTMPPKSTFIEPKIRSGMLILEF